MVTRWLNLTRLGTASQSSVRHGFVRDNHRGPVRSPDTDHVTDGAGAHRAIDGNEEKGDMVLARSLLSENWKGVVGCRGGSRYIDFPRCMIVM